MNKPKKQVIEHYDYHECAKYVEHKLGINDLRDIQGKFNASNIKNKDVEYQDFWHCICDNQDVTNGCYIFIFTEQDWPDWAMPIAEVFEQEFGEEYWVWW